MSFHAKRELLATVAPRYREASKKHKSIIEKVKILIQQKKDFINTEITNSKKAQEEYDSNKDDKAWLTLFENT